MSESPDEPKARPRACISCAKSKAKCVWPSGAGDGGESSKSCDRCMRQSLSCALPEPAPRKRRGKSTRVGQLEQKLDGIMSMLAARENAKTGQQLVASVSLGSEGPVAPAATAVGIPTPTEWPTPVSSAAGTSQPTALSPEGGRSASFSREASDFEVILGIRISFREADKILCFYRDELVPGFPFVPLANTVTSRDLYRQLPFLLRTIVIVAAPEVVGDQGTIQKWFREYIAEHIVAGQEKRLELLQAILVYFGWGDFHFYVDPQSTTIIQLAVSQVIDLGIGKPPSSLVVLPKSLAEEASAILKGRTMRRSLHSREDHRAMLGCFYVTSLVSTLFRRGHYFPYTNYMTICCDALLEAHEFPTDEFLITLIKLQRLSFQMWATFPHPESEGTELQAFRGPFDMAMQTIRKELDNIIESQPDSVKQNPFFWTHYQGVLVRLYEPAIFTKPADEVHQMFKRTQAMWSCLQSTKGFFDTFLATSVPYFSIPFAITSEVAFVLVTLSRLLLLDNVPDWDIALARSNVDLAAIASRLAERFDAEHALYLQTGRKELVDAQGKLVLKVIAEKLRWIRQWYLSKLPPAPAASVVTPAIDSGVGSMACVGQPDTGDMVMTGTGDGTSPPLDPGFWEALWSWDTVWYPNDENR